MSKVDDDLTRRLQRAERPVDGDNLFEGLQRRRTHRERLRRVQAGLVAFAVLAATAGGFAILRDAFDAKERNAGQTPPLPANGEIVFSRTSSGSEHLYIIEADGTDLRQITDGNGSDQFATWSPDGRRIVFMRQDRSSIRLYVLDLDSGDTQPITPPSMGVYRPAWSPDGELIAFAGVGADVSGIWVVRPDGSGLRRITDGPFNAPDAPRWSPDGSTIAFTSNLRDPDGGYREGWDVYLVGRDGSGLRNLTATPDPEQSESPIGWLPDGNLLLSESPGSVGSGPGLPIQMGRWLEITPAGDVVRTVLEEPVNTEDHLQEPRLSPDGRFVIFDSARGGTQEVWFVELTTLDFTQVTTTGGWLPAWKPIQRIGSDLSPTPTPEPSISPEPEPNGQDIGLGVQMCDLEVLDGIDWDGTGVDGSAWTGAPVDEDGGCSSSADVQHIVAVDRDGDGVAEQGSTSTLRTCLLCRPFDTVDLNDDGVLELVVLEEASSTPTYSVFEVNRPGSERSPGVYPIIVIAPGAPAMNLDAGEAVRFTVGGDEGFSGSIVCEGAGAGSPILRYTWVRGEVDADTELRVDITRLWFGEDGVFHIESVDRFSVPRNPEPTELRSTEPACGVDFHPDA